MSKYWSRLAARLTPYVPGEQPRDGRYIKLNTNENPYGPSPTVLKAVRDAADESLRLYPDPTCDVLLSAAADYYGVRKDQVFAGNGSDEILAFSFMAFFDPGRTILFPDVTYSFYPVYADLCSLSYRLVPVTDDFDIPVEQLYGSPGGVVIANPNAPTGKYLSLDSVKRVLDKNADTVVLVDEAYIDFGGDSAVRLVPAYPNLLVVHTFSKSRALAGMRIGFAVGNSDLIDGLIRVKDSFNSYTMDRLAIVAGTEAFKDRDWYKDVNGRVVKTRERVTDEMRELGFTVLDSAANFIFASHPAVTANALFEELKARGILVRYFRKPRVDNYLRISIGTDEQMDRFLDTVAQCIDDLR